MKDQDYNNLNLHNIIIDGVDRKVEVNQLY